jgi:hypothetical protein
MKHRHTSDDKMKFLNQSSKINIEDNKSIKNAERLNSLTSAKTPKNTLKVSPTATLKQQQERQQQ